MIIFGPNIAREIAGTVPGLSVNSTGEVTSIVGPPLEAMQKLIGKYQELSEPVALLQFRLLLDQYADIFLEYNQPLPSVWLTCSLIERR
jgi:hypothetical protein